MKFGLKKIPKKGSPISGKIEKIGCPISDWTCKEKASQACGNRG